jgi:hypothetical protein
MPLPVRLLAQQQKAASRPPLAAAEAAAQSLARGRETLAVTMNREEIAAFALAKFKLRRRPPFSCVHIGVECLKLWALLMSHAGRSRG